MKRIISHDIDKKGIITYTLDKDGRLTVRHTERYKNKKFISLVKDYVKNSNDPKLIETSKYGLAAGVNMPVTHISEENTFNQSLDNETELISFVDTDANEFRNYLNEPESEIKIEGLRPVKNDILFLIEENDKKKVKSYQEMKMYHTLQTLKYLDSSLEIHKSKK